MIRIILVLFVLTYLGESPLHAQEFNASVKVNVPNIQNADPQLFVTMENQMNDFLNNTRWTDVSYKEDEKIELSLQFNIVAELSDQSFRVDLYIQCVRPTYNSEYKTPILTHVDKDVFIEYVPFMELNNSQTNYFNNLSSVLSFYAYFALGMDYDTFSPMGGDEHFLTCKAITATIPQSMIDADPGWQSIATTRNRFILLQDLISPRMRGFRESYYNYHRHSLDKMSEDVTAASDVMISALRSIGEVNRNTPNSMLLQVFANTKRDEIVEILKASSSTGKTDVYQVMSKIDPANISKYRLIRT